MIHFRAVHSVCLWDDKGPQKVYQALQDDILEFIKHAQNVSILEVSKHASRYYQDLNHEYPSILVIVTALSSTIC
jgi:hypothetical protein